MKRKVKLALVVMVCSAPGLLGRSASRFQESRIPATLVQADSQRIPGQTATLMPDGKLLLIGGEGKDGPLAVAIVFDPLTGTKITLSSQLATPRAWHTATLLPDGKVLILGGLDASGKVVEKAEAFDLETKTFNLLPPTLLVPRAHHSATLLTDGRLLVVGGVSEAGETLANAQLWNSKTQSQTSLPDGLVIARQGHQATLLPDGQVLLLGGVGTDGRTLENGELYDPEAESFSLINTPPSTQNGIEEGPQVAASLPEDGSGNVPADVLVGIRFSEPLDVRTVSGLTIKLSGPNGEIAIKVVPAESGLLAFVSPNQELEAATRYTINLDGLADPLKRVLNESQISFTTSEGGLWVPTSNDWKTGLPASRWQLLEPLTAPPGVTAI